MSLRLNQLTTGLFDLLERATNTEQTFVSAERLNTCEFDGGRADVDIEVQTQEPQGGVVPRASWPEKGDITIRNLRVKYAEDLPEVLHGVSVDIRVSLIRGRADVGGRKGWIGWRYGVWKVYFGAESVQR